MRNECQNHMDENSLMRERRNCVKKIMNKQILSPCICLWAPTTARTVFVYMCVCLSTFSSRALWCSNSDFRALRTSTSLETPDGGGACLFTTVILRLRSWRDTRHSRCSNSSYSTGAHPTNKENTNFKLRNIICFHQHHRTHLGMYTLKWSVHTHTYPSVVPFSFQLRYFLLFLQQLLPAYVQLLRQSGELLHSTHMTTTHRLVSSRINRMKTFANPLQIWVSSLSIYHTWVRLIIIKTSFSLSHSQTHPVNEPPDDETVTINIKQRAVTYLSLYLYLLILHFLHMYNPLKLLHIH